jgi:hypothetical protein
MSFCTKCGTEQLQEGSYCPKCGQRKLSGGEPASPERKEPIERGQICAALGSAILFFGVFAPYVSVPVMGTINYFKNGRGDGTIILLLAAASLFISIAHKYKWLWLTGGASLAVVTFDFLYLQLKLSELTGQLNTDLTSNPFRGLVDVAIQSVQLQWGFPLLIVGSILVMAAAAFSTNFQMSTIRLRRCSVHGRPSQPAAWCSLLELQS